ncbi:MAG: ABC transporter permease [Clostridiales bacterium]|nr:ABC transporter permease [Clostridiales bacterium]
MEVKSKLKNFFHNRWASLCRTWHHVAISIPFIVVAGSIALSVASVIRINSILDGQFFQYSAEYFGSENLSYRQLTVISRGLEQDDGSAPRACSEGLNQEKVQQLHEALALTEESNNSSSKRNQAIMNGLQNLWADCYSSTATYPAKGYLNKDERGSVTSAEIVGVGGNYGMVHPFRYESGGFLAAEGGDRFAIVLNTQMAWNLFHSYEVLGAEVEINQTRYEVVGVVCEGDDAIAEATDVTKPRAYVNFGQLARLINGPSVSKTDSDIDNSVKETDLAVTCYEVLLTDPIKNIAYNDLMKVLGDELGYQEGNTVMEVVNNTGRFNVLRLYEKYFPLKKSVDSLNGIKLPFHERSARLAEQYVVFWAEMLIVGGIGLITGLCGVYAAIHGRKSKHEIIYVDSDDETLMDIHRV